jgi:hypothetical protein
MKLSTSPLTSEHVTTLCYESIQNMATLAPELGLFRCLNIIDTSCATCLVANS